jgi:GNAT superfamily N-acetyltransferase
MVAFWIDPMSHDVLTIDEAVVGDGPELTRMVRTSGAYDGIYRVMVANQTIDATYIDANPVRVARGAGGRMRGFYSLHIPGMGAEGEGELDFMFVADDHQRRGVGQALFADLRAMANQLRLTRIHIVSHPPAEAFYRGRGARPVGHMPPKGAVVWSRPHLILDV